MPTVDLLSNGEQITILYDVLGAGATCSREDQADSQQQENPKHSTSTPPTQPQQAPEAGRKPQTVIVNPGDPRCTSTTIEAAPHLSASGPPVAVSGCSQALKEEQHAADAIESNNSQITSSAPEVSHHLSASKQPCYTRSGSFEPRLTPSMSDSAHEQMSSGKQACNEAPHCSKGVAETSSSQKETDKVLFIAGLSARGRTEFLQHVVDHLASLEGSDGSKLLSVCTFDNRGIGGSTIPKQKRRYSTLAMAHDTLALLDHLGWSKVHIVGLSLGGMIASKLAAMRPDRIASLTMIATTTSGWQMLLGVSSHPLTAVVAGNGPLKWKIPANLRYNFSEGYLEQHVEGGKTRMQVLVNNTHKAIETKDTMKFLAEGQPSHSRQGHLWAVFKHRLTAAELRVIREAKFPCQLIVGRHDRLVRAYFVQRMAQRLHCPLLIVEAAHAGIMIEALPSILPQLESAILGTSQTAAHHVNRLGVHVNEVALRNHTFAKEFATTFSPGRFTARQLSRSKTAG